MSEPDVGFEAEQLGIAERQIVQLRSDDFPLRGDAARAADSLIDGGNPRRGSFHPARTVSGVTAVADTSVMLNPSVLGQAGLLADLFGTVLAPPEVQAEFQRLAASGPRFLGLPFPEFVQMCAVAAIHSLLLGNRHLYAGEIAALSLAEELQADAVLLDDRAARTLAPKNNSPQTFV